MFEDLTAHMNDAMSVDRTLTFTKELEIAKWL